MGGEVQWAGGDLGLWEGKGYRGGVYTYGWDMRVEETREGGNVGGEGIELWTHCIFWGLWFWTNCVLWILGPG